jgi:uncharacterized membrane protein
MLYIIFAVLSALFCMVGTIYQRVEVNSVPAEVASRRRTWHYLARRPKWLTGMAAMVASGLFQALALKFGSLALVGPLLALNLIFILAALHFVYKVRLGAREWLGGLAIVSGIGAFLYMAAPKPGLTLASPHKLAILFGAELGLTVIMLIFSAKKSRRFCAGSLSLLAATGFAVTSALTKQVISMLGGVGLGIFGHWELYALAVVGIGAFFMVQHAYRAGPMAVSQPIIAVCGPIASVIIGETLFNELISSSPMMLIVEFFALAVMALGIYAVAASKRILADQTLSIN